MSRSTRLLVVGTCAFVGIAGIVLIARAFLRDPEPSQATMVQVTATPVLAGAMSPEEATEYLRQQDHLAPVIDSVLARDVASFKDALAFKDQFCTPPGGRTYTQPCDSAVTQDTAVPMINVGDVTDLWITEAAFQPYLDLILGSADLRLTYAAESPSTGLTYLAFEGGPLALNFPPIGSADAQITGFFLVTDPKSPQSVNRVSLLLNTYTTADHVRQLQGVDAEQKVLTFEPLKDAIE